MTSTLLEIEGIEFSYGTVPVLFHTSLSINEGEVVAVIGPNGAGKTTLLRVLAGLEKASRGTIRIGGEDITRLLPEERVQRRLVIVFGGHAVFGELTVDDNLTVGGQLLHRTPNLLEERRAEAYEIFPRLAERKKALAVQLSGGEQQMLALAKAFLLQPRVLCIDELSLGLAPTLVARLLDVVRRFRQSGITVLLVEQSVRVALSIADRCAWFERGEVREIRDAAELRERPELLHELFLARTPSS
jgi:ABC-type branched-subunit amino acid transport system ATPase component